MERNTPFRIVADLVIILLLTAGAGLIYVRMKDAPKADPVPTCRCECTARCEMPVPDGGLR